MSTGLGLVVLLGSLAGVADASLLRGLTGSELRDGSEAIVSGRVTSVRSIRAGGRIETVARVRLRESWRGPTSGTLTVRSPGGTLGGRRLVVPGAASMARGDDVLLFLYRDGRAWRPVGMFQGVWRIDADDPTVLRPSNGAGAALLPPTRGTAAVERPERSLAWLVGAAEGSR